MKIRNLIISISLVMLVATGCSKSDEYKLYSKDGERIYSGKLDSVKVLTGNLRVKIIGLLPADPKISKIKMSWNDGRDSVLYSISKLSKIDTLSKMLNVAEGIYNFKIQTFDEQGNGSMISRATGSALGPKYESGLVNRQVTNAEILPNGNAEIRWASFDASSGARGTWIKYIKSNLTNDSLYVPLSESVSILPNLKDGTAISVKTLYRPAMSIDDFFAPPQMVNVIYDVTANYIPNAGVNFISLSVGNDRWQTPANWITTADVRNGGNNIGGIDAASSLPSRALSIEAWFGMTAVPNGKIYQSVLLPAGKYFYVVTAGDCSSGGMKYITISSGTSLPDIGDVTTKSIAYKLFEKNTDNKLQFTLLKPTQVSIGMQANLPAEGNYMKVFKVRLLYTP